MNKSSFIWGAVIWIAMVLGIVAFSFVPLGSAKDVWLPPVDSKLEKLVIFFGFPSCHDVCPTTMAQLSHIFTESDTNIKPSTSVLFVNIDSTLNQQQTHDYAQNFHSDFIGYQPSIDEMARFTADFGLNIGQRGQLLTHRGRLYIVERSELTWQLVQTINPSAYAKDILSLSLTGIRI